MSVCLPGGLFLTRDELRFIAHCAPEIRAKCRRDGVDSPMLRDALRVAQEVVLGSDSQRVPISAGSDASGHGGGSGWIPTRAAAGRLEISMRRVVYLLHEGRLCGRQQATNSAWQVSEESVLQYRAEQSMHV
jgi:hypothetical protein